MSVSKTWTVPMDQLTASNYNFYIWGMTSADAEATINIKDPNGNTWTRTTSGLTKGQVFNFPNPLSKSDPYVQPFGWTIPSTATPYTFEVTISSTAAGSNEGISITATNDSSESVMAVVQYNDPDNSDKDYNDVVLTLAFFPEEPYGS